jgi:hypothetical protein
MTNRLSLSPIPLQQPQCRVYFHCELEKWFLKQMQIMCTLLCQMTFVLCLDRNMIVRIVFVEHQRFLKVLQVVRKLNDLGLLPLLHIGNKLREEPKYDNIHTYVSTYSEYRKYRMSHKLIMQFSGPLVRSIYSSAELHNKVLHWRHVSDRSHENVKYGRAVTFNPECQPDYP